ncbi:tetratricopeptide repeat protein [Marivita geojedonensis]|uniref:DUF560 domain-containing protein n=1 Tax=Marivita geojedonensis TaxID=1123756 RepID=A0A1X4NIB8_9RHOB|nr:hypothetical protein [Marivita geojedonensis]OSQ48232.1 hypothetical protein MGEO_15065 [Marivita geojedonensis]PRY74894.1 hypothetical protein CLV76_11732 [Marivita geojedonensis]
MTRWSRRIALTLGAVAFAAAQASAQAILNPAQMRELAGQAVLQGQAGLAYDLSGALIQRDDADLNAHLIRSRAARDLGRYDDALSHARSAWKLAEDEDAKYAAALAMAQALSSSGRRTAAQLWLRRAVQLASTDARKARATEDFRYVRRQNPWATALRFSVAPSSNINNGSRNETSELFGLPFEFSLEGEARALSGVEISTGLSTRYRLRESAMRRTDLLFGLSHRTYVLSDEARDIAPDADGADFATSSVFVGVQEDYALPGGKAQLGWNARIGRTWYGGDPLLSYNRIGATYRRAAGDTGVLNLSLSREGQKGHDTREDATIWSGQIGYGMALANGNRVSLSTGFTESRSDADYLDYSQRMIAASYGLAKPVGPAQLEFGLSVSQKIHDRSSLTTDGRDERTIKATVTAVLPDMDFYGFVPTITFNAERTEANIDLYETENFGVQLGIRSTF